MIYYLITFLMMTILYVYVSYKKKNIINLLFFYYLNSGLIMVFLYTVNLYYIGNYFDLRKGDYYLLFYFWVSYIGCALIELKKVTVKGETIQNKTVSKTPIFLIGLFIIFYWLLHLDTLKLAITNPRMFYANSRIGGGFLYYIIIPLTIFVYFYYITRLNYSGAQNRFKNNIKALIATVIICLFIYIFGQKSTILLIGLLYVTTIFYKNSDSKKNIRVLFLGLLFAVGFIAIFILYTFQQNIQFNGILRNLAGYSDYLINFCDLVDNLDGFKYGQVFLEDEFFSYIPRALWSSKPVLFGSLKLGLEVPRLVEWTLSLTGAPSFGPIGQSYADFGFVGILMKLTVEFVFLSIARKYEERLLKKYSFFNHFLFLTFNGVLIFSITLTTFPIYQLGVIALLYLVAKSKTQKRCVYATAY